MVFVTERTWHNWESGRIRVPYAVFKLFRILTGFELPGDAWSDWMLLGGVLISPEGKKFAASDLSYLSLTVAMARQWRIDQRMKYSFSSRQKKSNLIAFNLPKDGGKNISSIG